MSLITNHQLEKLCKDLTKIDQLKVLEHLKTLSIDDTARIIGYDLSNYDHTILSGRLLMFDLQLSTPNTVEEYVEILEHRFMDNIKNFMLKHKVRIQVEFDKRRENDFMYDFFSASTMIKTYLAKPYFEEDVCETPQWLFIRVAVQLYYDEGIEQVIHMYDQLSRHLYTPASPTLTNAGFNQGCLSSCFLSRAGDNIENLLYHGVGDQGVISKEKGGLGFDMSLIRCSEIKSVGNSKGIIPFVKIYNEMVRAVDQMAMRKGALCLYLRAHHINVFEFCELTLKTGDKNMRANDINTSLWMPWIFFDRLKKKGKWTIFCPAKTPELNNVYGITFSNLYVKAEERAEKREQEYLRAVENKKKVEEKIQRGEGTKRDQEYKQVMKEYRDSHRARIQHKVVDAENLYTHIIKMQIRCGMPFLCHGDSCNFKSNHRYLGYIPCSNLCQEIVEYSDENCFASCNLSSISLKAFARKKISHFAKTSDQIESSLRDAFDFQWLGEISRMVVRNLNKVIDHNRYPLDSIDKNGKLIEGIIHKPNSLHRPIGFGVSGFAEALHHIDLPFEDERTVLFNKMVFACMYFHGLFQSIQMALYEGPHPSFPNSPFSQGKLQFDLWKEEYNVLKENGLLNEKIRKEKDDEPISPMIWGQVEIALCNSEGYIIDYIKPTWVDMRRCVIKYGMRNSLLMALMPTATSSQILRNAECIEPHTSNIYSRRVMNGAYPVMNRYLYEDVKELNLWNSHFAKFLLAKNGSIETLDQYIHSHSSLFPDFVSSSETESRLLYIMKKYRTMWEISQKHLLKMSADRARYIDQSQSTNFYKKDPTMDEMKALHLYTHSLGLKNGMYYLRQLPSIEPIKFTVDPKFAKYTETLEVKPIIIVEEKEEKKVVPIIIEEEEKLMCKKNKEDGIECISCQS